MWFVLFSPPCGGLCGHTYSRSRPRSPNNNTPEILLYFLAIRSAVFCTEYIFRCQPLGIPDGDAVHQFGIAGEFGVSGGAGLANAHTLVSFFLFLQNFFDRRPYGKDAIGTAAKTGGVEVQGFRQAYFAFGLLQDGAPRRFHAEVEFKFLDVRKAFGEGSGLDFLLFFALPPGYFQLIFAGLMSGVASPLFLKRWHSCRLLVDSVPFPEGVCEFI